MVLNELFLVHLKGSESVLDSPGFVFFFLMICAVFTSSLNSMKSFVTCSRFLEQIMAIAPCFGLFLLLCKQDNIFSCTWL